MRAVLEILDGPLAGRTVELSPGQTVSVGRTAKSQLMLPHDNFLSGLHFQVECQDDGCILKDCNSSNGTWVNGNKILHHALVPGDQVAAGQTRFKVHLEAEGGTVLSEIRPTSSTVLFTAPKMEDGNATSMHRPQEMVALSHGQQTVVKYLQLQPAPLYALLNASVEERVPNFLLGSGEVYQFVPEGLTIGEDMPPGVYLVYLPATSPLLPKLVFEGWCKHWTLYFTCTYPFAEVRKHLRQLMVMHTEEGKRFFFRYYDPRVLQFFLPACTTQELTHLFGPIHSFLLEDALDQSKLIEFNMTPKGLGGRVVTLG